MVLAPTSALCVLSKEAYEAGTEISACLTGLQFHAGVQSAPCIPFRVWDGVVGNGSS